MTYYSQFFKTVELNNTFYRLPSEKMLTRWRTATPDNFKFAVKVSRLITHFRQLQACEKALFTFLDRITLLEDKLGPILFQLPPSLSLDLDRLKALMELLTNQSIVPDLKGVLEVRHPSWLVPAVFTQLQTANVALCWADGTQLTVEEPLTADFVYIRRHGSSGATDQGYSLEQLRGERDRICRWVPHDYDVYIYFNNDGCGYAVQNAQQLLNRIYAFC